jgi:peptide/nickel transport system substrate-binding protein
VPARGKKRSVRTSSASAVLAILSFVVIGCGAPGGDGASQRAAPNTLVWGVQIEPGHLNPLVSTSGIATDLQHLLFMPLNAFGPPPEFDLRPILADHWEISDDRKTVTYFLRQDVVWHDGVPTTAKDVKFTYDMMIQPDLPYPQKQKLRLVEACEVVNEWTVRFHFSEPSWEPIFDTQFFVVPEHVLASVPPADMVTSSFSRKPVGNGPWKFVEWTRGQQIVLEANEAFASGRPGFDRLVLRVVPEATTLLTELKTGSIDVYHRLPSVRYREIANDPAFEVHRVPDRTYVYLGWNLRDPKYQDVNVRRALTMAIDRWAILDAFRDGFGTVIAPPPLAQYLPAGSHVLAAAAIDSSSNGFDGSPGTVNQRQAWSPVSAS